MTNMRVKRCQIETLEAAFALGDLEKAEELLEAVEALPPGERTPLLRGQALRFRARLDAEQSRYEEVDANFSRAVALFREHELVFDQAVTELERVEWLTSQNRLEEAQPLIAGARDILEELRAEPWLERLEASARTPAEIHA